MRYWGHPNHGKHDGMGITECFIGVNVLKFVLSLPENKGFLHKVKICLYVVQHKDKKS